MTDKGSAPGPDVVAIADPASIKARFEFGINDMIDVNRRALAASTTFRAIQRSGMITGGVFLAVLAFWLRDGPLWERLTAAAVAVAAWWAIYPFIRRAALESRLRKYWKEHLEGEGPFSLEIELNDAGLKTRQFGTEALSPWPMVKSVEEKDGALEITIRQRGMIVVRDRAFATAQEKQRFVGFVRGRLEAEGKPGAR